MPKNPSDLVTPYELADLLIKIRMARSLDVLAVALLGLSCQGKQEEIAEEVEKIAENNGNFNAKILAIIDKVGVL